MPPLRRVIVHADLDAFYAAVEQLDDPSLRGRAILVGGTHRGVVLTASYEARPFGVHSAMPMATARRMCPHAIVVPPRFERYTELSSQVMDVFEDFAPKVEPISLDEAFLDMTGAETVFGPVAGMARALKDAVRDATGLIVSVGVAETKYVAKVASDLEKPDGLTIVPFGGAVEFLRPLSVSRLWGVGPKTEPRLHALGLRTIGDVAAADPDRLERELGVIGLHFHRLAWARDPRPVIGSRRARSMGSERTLGADIQDPEAIKKYLRRSADEIARRLRKKQICARGVRVKLKTASFRLMTRQAILPAPTNVGQRIYRAGVSLLPLFDYGEPFRLVGMAAYDLEDERPQQLDLFDPWGRRLRLESTLDLVRGRFGDGLLLRAHDLANPAGRRMAVNLDALTDRPPLEEHPHYRIDDPDW